MSSEKSDEGPVEMVYDHETGTYVESKKKRKTNVSTYPGQRKQASAPFAVTSTPSTNSNSYPQHLTPTAGNALSLQMGPPTTTAPSSNTYEYDTNGTSRPSNGTYQEEDPPPSSDTYNDDIPLAGAEVVENNTDATNPSYPGTVQH